MLPSKDTLIRSASTMAKEERARNAASIAKEQQAEKLAILAKTANLRALRLAKEAEMASQKKTAPGKKAR